MTTLAPPSYCIDCDAAEKQCDHRGNRYHEAIVYEPGPSHGWLVPAGEREWFHRERGEAETAGPHARPLHTLLAALGRLMYLDDRSEELLTEKYDAHPLKVSMMCSDLERSCQTGRLTHPTGILIKRLREMRA